MTTFTPVAGLVGGCFIGVAAGILLLGCGEIMGASGILSSLLTRPIRTISSPAEKWKIVFLASFAITSFIVNFVIKSLGSGQSEGGPFVSTFGFALSGFLVGFGTKLSQGCTTGHGICGMARLSIRSTVGAIAFMGTGFVTASILSNKSDLFRCETPIYPPNFVSINFSVAITASLIHFAMPIFTFTDPTDEEDLVSSESTPLDEENRKDSSSHIQNLNAKKAPLVALSASVFAVSLAIAGMIDNRKILNFLDLTGFSSNGWDPTLAFVMGGGVIISAITYQYVHGYNLVLQDEDVLACPLKAKEFNLPSRENDFINTKLLVGGGMFGVGWGISGICPGPSIYLALVGYPQVLFCFMPTFALGAYLAERQEVLKLFE